MEGEIEYIDGEKDIAFEKFEKEVMGKHSIERISSMPTRIIDASSFKYGDEKFIDGIKPNIKGTVIKVGGEKNVKPKGKVINLFK